MKILTLSIAEARPGMKLAADICDAKQAVLLPAGTALTASHLSALPRHGVVQIPVERPPLTVQEEEPVRRRLNHLFRRVGDDELSRALERSILAYHLGRQP